MGLYDLLRRLLSRLAGAEPVDEPDDEPAEPEPPDIPAPVSPLVYGERGEATRLDIHVYQTAALTERRGRTPEQNAVRFLARALRKVGYNYAIHLEHDTVSAPEEANTGEALAWWSSRAPSWPDDTEVHLLITDTGGGGIAYHGESNTRSGRYARAPGRNIEAVTELVDIEPESHPYNAKQYTNTRANLHEAGHTLGGRHRDGMIPAPHMLYQNTEDGWLDAPPP